MVGVRVAVLAVAVIIVAAVAVLLLMPAPPPTTEATTTQLTSPQTNIVSLTLYLNDYGFNASKGGPKITVFVGDTIRIRLIGNSSGPAVHDFVLDDKSPSPYNVKSDRLGRGQEQVIEFLANVAGVYKYYCSVAPPAGPSHRERGQEAVIEIMPRG